MKKILLSALLAVSVMGSIAEARYTHDYYRADGTHVNGYWGS